MSERNAPAEGRGDLAVVATLLPYLRPYALRIAFASILFLSGLKLVEIPHANLVVTVAASVAAVVLAVWSVRQLVARRLAAAVD